jgi:putative flippase GtrA
MIGSWCAAGQRRLAGPADPTPGTSGAPSIGAINLQANGGRGVTVLDDDCAIRGADSIGLGAAPRRAPHHGPRSHRSAGTALTVTDAFTHRFAEYLDLVAQDLQRIVCQSRLVFPHYLRVPKARPLSRPWPGRFALKEIGRYLFLGSAIYGVSLIVMFCLTDLLGLGELVAYALMQALISCAGFLVARRWVFQARGGHLLTQASRFLASSVFFRLLNLALYSLLWTLLALPREIGILVTIALLFPVKYVVEKTLVFTRRSTMQRRGAQAGLDPAPAPAPLWP